jgi:HAMP domain-containing protein
MAGQSGRGLGLLPKLMVAILAPVVISFGVIACVYLFDTREMISTTMAEMENLSTSVIAEMETMSEVATKEGVQTLRDLGEQMIREKSIDVARQVEVFMKYNPKLRLSSLRRNKELKKIAVQPVGKTGYTAVHDDEGINHFHKSPKIVGMNLRTLAGKYPEFWAILEQSLNGEASGYYEWPEPDGTVKSKYMVITPVRGTKLRVAATTYIEEFSGPARRIEEQLAKVHKRTERKILAMAGRTLDRFRKTSQKTLHLFLVVVGLCLVVIIILTFWFSRRMIRPIIHLTRAANRISMGDLDTRVEISSRDEVGLLAESFARMQESLKAAITRIRRRRVQV